MPRPLNRVPLLAQPGYDPNPLLNTVQTKLALDSDAALARALRLTAPEVSKIRSRRLPISARALIRVHEHAGLPFVQIRQLIGVDADALL